MYGHGVQRPDGYVRSPFVGGDLAAITTDPTVRSYKQPRDAWASLLLPASAVGSNRFMSLDFSLSSFSRFALSWNRWRRSWSRFCLWFFIIFHRHTSASLSSAFWVIETKLEHVLFFVKFSFLFPSQTLCFLFLFSVVLAIWRKSNSCFLITVCIPVNMSRFGFFLSLVLDG